MAAANPNRKFKLLNICIVILKKPAVDFVQNLLFENYIAVETK